MEIDFFERLTGNAAERPSHPAMQTLRETGREALTYAQVLPAVSRISQSLAGKGIVPGDRVAILMENDHYWALALLGIAGAGAVAVPLDPAQSSSRLIDTLIHAECRMIFLAAEFEEHLRAIHAALPALSICRKDGAGEPASTIGDAWGKLCAASGPPGAWPLIRHDPDADMLVVYTGGTTGTPKGVRLSLRALLSTIRGTTRIFPLSPSDHILSILPLFHIMAIQASILGPLYKGSAITYLVTKEPKRIVEAFAQEHPTAFLCVPLFYSQLRRRILDEVSRQPRPRQMVFHTLLRLSRFLRRTLGWNAGRVLLAPIHRKFGSKLRGFGVGGARFDPALAESLHDLGFPFFQGYGMTETSALSTVSPMSIRGGASCGKPLDCAGIRIDQPDEHGIGEIKISGSHLMSGYLKDPEATAQVLRDGWLSTGDLGYLSSDGLHVTGRKKDVIVLSSGKNVFPEPLEHHYLSSCPLLTEICVCCVPEAHGGSERLRAVLVPDFAELRRRGIVNVREAILYELQSAGKVLPPHERLHGFDIRQQPLPRTSARKLLRYRIVEELAGTQAEPAAAVDAEESVSGPAAEVFEIIRRLKGVAAIRLNMDLELDLGLDSLERVELLAAVQDRLRCTLSEEQSQQILTVAQLLDAVSASQSAGGPAASESHPPESAWTGILNDPLTEEEQRIADAYLGPRPLAAPLLFLFTRLVCFFARLLLRFDYKSEQPLPSEGRLVIAANHQSNLDTPLLTGSLPYSVFRRVFFLSTSRLHRGALSIWFGKAARAVPIDPDRRLRAALRIAAEGLRRGMVLCVFPEGHRSMDENLLPFRKGLAILAVDQRAEVLPAGIAGTGKAWGRGASRLHFVPVAIRTGTILKPSPESTPEQFNEELFAAVQRLAMEARAVNKPQ